MSHDTLGRFGHHPDPAIDFCIEVDALEGMYVETQKRIQTFKPFLKRLKLALPFRVGGDVQAVTAMQTLRGIAKKAGINE